MDQITSFYKTQVGQLFSQRQKAIHIERMLSPRATWIEAAGHRKVSRLSRRERPPLARFFG